MGLLSAQAAGHTGAESLNVNVLTWIQQPGVVDPLHATGPASWLILAGHGRLGRAAQWRRGGEVELNVPFCSFGLPFASAQSYVRFPPKPDISAVMAAFDPLRTSARIAPDKTVAPRGGQECNGRPCQNEGQFCRLESQFSTAA